MSKSLSKNNRTEVQTKLGQLLTSFSYLELNLQNSVANILNLDRKISVRIVSGEFFSLVFKIVKVVGLYRLTEDQLKQEFKSIMGEIKRCGEERNEYVHSFYEHDVFSNSFRRIRLKKDTFTGSSLPQISKVDPSDLENLCQRIIDVNTQFNKFVKTNFSKTSRVKRV